VGSLSVTTEHLVYPQPYFPPGTPEQRSGAEEKVESIGKDIKNKNIVTNMLVSVREEC